MDIMAGLPQFTNLNCSRACNHLGMSLLLLKHHYNIYLYNDRSIYKQLYYTMISII